MISNRVQHFLERRLGHVDNELIPYGVVKSNGSNRYMRVVVVITQLRPASFAMFLRYFRATPEKGKQLTREINFIPTLFQLHLKRNRVVMSKRTVPGSPFVLSTQFNLLGKG